MKPIRVLIFAVVALLQLSVPGWAAWVRTQTLSKGKLWKFRTAPIDPIDVVRGRYVTLAFAAESVPQAQPLPPASDAYAVLKEGENGFATVDRLSTTPVHGDNVMKVKPRGWYDGSQRVDFPFDRFWLTEKIAPDAERAYRASNRQARENAYVTVRVHDGDAALEQLYLNDQPLLEYLRDHPPQ